MSTQGQLEQCTMGPNQRRVQTNIVQARREPECFCQTCSWKTLHTGFFAKLHFKYQKLRWWWWLDWRLETPRVPISAVEWLATQMIPKNQWLSRMHSKDSKIYTSLCVSIWPDHLHWETVLWHRYFIRAHIHRLKCTCCMANDCHVYST